MSTVNCGIKTATWKTKDGWLEMTASDFITLYN